MTTKELEKKLKISENTYIHCPTLELAKRALSIFHTAGLNWRTRQSFNEFDFWYIYKENTVCRPFKYGFSHLEYAQLIGYKIISAEEFIALHTEGKEFELENYEPKGELTGFPKEIIARMLQCQEEQGNKRDVTVFEKYNSCSLVEGGFDWEETKEKDIFWYDVICNKDFDIFFKKYPKQDNQYNNSQEFKVGDEVVDIISGVRGKITCIDTLNNDSYPIFVEFNDNEEASFTLDGRYYSLDKHPSLLHYRDDYDYSVIDFNNLPKRQEPKRWRAEEEGVYHFVNFLTKGWFFSDESSDDYDCPIDNNNYNSGNYFRTEVEAEIIAQKLNTYFKQLIKEEHDTHRN